MARHGSMRILLIEDDPADVRLLKEYLAEARSCRFEVTHEGRLSAGLNRLAGQHFDAVLLDLALSESQGLDTVIQVRAAAKKIPLVVLTEVEDEVLAVRLTRAGVQDYLVKGQMSGPLLTRSLRYAVELARMEESVGEVEGRFLGYIGSVMDVTDRKKSDQLEADQKRVLELIAKEAPLSTVFETLIRMIEEQSAARMVASILLMDADGIHLRSGAAPSLPEAYNRSIDGLAIGPHAGSCGTAAYRRRPVYVSDIAGDPLWADFAALALPHNLRACWSTPILSSTGRLFGTLAMYYPDVREPNKEDLRLVDVATRLAAIAIERKRAEEALRLAKFSVERAADAVYWIDSQAKILDVNEAASRMLSYSKDELCAMTVHDLNPDFQADMWPGFWAETKRRGTMMFETVHRAKNGRLIPIEVSVNFLVHEGKEYHCAFVRDITERKRTEEERNKQESLLSLMLNTGPGCIKRVAADGTLLQMNPAGLKLIEASCEDEVVGRCVFDLVVPEHRAAFIDMHRDVLTGRSHTIEFEIQGLKGTRRWMETHAVLFRNPVSGEPEHLAVTHDITQRKRAEAALKASETRFRAIFDQTFQFIGLMKTDGTVIEANRSALQFADLKEEDVLGKLFWDTPWWTHSSELQNRLREAVRQAAGGTMVRFEATHPRLTGELAYVDFSVKPVRDEHGNVILLIPEGRDITERKRTEDRLQHTLDRVRTLSQRLEMVREEERTKIARELHDELGVRLTCFRLDLARLKSFMSWPSIPCEEIEKRIRSMTAEVDATIALVQRLVAELRPGILDDLGLAAAVEWQCQDLERRSGIRCSCEAMEEHIPLPKPLVTAAFRICQEALMNVVRHAEATAVRVRLEQVDGYLQLEVSDDGIGISPDKLSDSRSFGLLGMRERAASLGGQIEIVGRSEKGTTVVLQLPLKMEGKR